MPISFALDSREGAGAVLVVRVVNRERPFRGALPGRCREPSDAATLGQNTCSVNQRADRGRLGRLRRVPGRPEEAARPLLAEPPDNDFIA